MDVTQAAVLFLATLARGDSKVRLNNFKGINLN